MNVWVGTSGYNYPEWKGSFYPETLPSAKMLPYYAERFPTVEINYTFYRAPNEKILAGWNAATPERFKLTLKAPKRITHDSRLRDCGDRVRQFLETAASARAEARRAALSAAAQPEEGPRALRRLSRDLSAPRLRGLRVPPRRRGSTRRCTRGCAPGTSRCAWPTARSSRRRSRSRADYAYFRLRDEGYTADDIARWAGPIAERTSALSRGVRLLQARRGREGAGVRADADGPSA